MSAVEQFTLPVDRSDWDQLLADWRPLIPEGGRPWLLTKFGELKRKLESNPFAKMLFPAVEKVYDADCRLRARRQLFRAAIAVVQGGKEKLLDFPDPFGKGPFEYVELPMGFELTSKLVHNNQPVSIVVGVPRQK